MIAFFGTYAEARRWAKENDRPLKELAIMPINGEKLHGKLGEIEVVFGPTFQPTEEAMYAMDVINMYNAQYESLRERDIEEATSGEVQL